MSSATSQQTSIAHHDSNNELVPPCTGVTLTNNNVSIGQAGDRGSCSADSGVRGSSDRESGGATSIGGNLSDSTTDGEFFLAFFCITLICISYCYVREWSAINFFIIVNFKKKDKEKNCIT